MERVNELEQLKQLNAEGKALCACERKHQKYQQQKKGIQSEYECK